jgi:arginine/lysine/ornithine decarboxylase
MDKCAGLDYSAAPLLEALADYHATGRYGFTPPGHRQSRGADRRTIAAIGQDAFGSDLLATAGLDDRKSSHGYLSRAEQLMADAVGADRPFFSTCGSSLSVKAAMLAVAGGHGDLLLSRDAHKSVVAGLVFSGVQPQWIRPRYDGRLHVAHPPSPRQVQEAWQDHPDAAGALIVCPTPYGTCADIKTIADICHRRGKPLIVDEAWVPTCPSTRTCRPGPWTPARTCAWSARTRWAPASSRDQSSTSRAARWTRTSCPPAPTC